MAPSWSFQQITPSPPANPGQSPVKFSSEKMPISTHLLDTEPTRYAMTYDRLHLLGLPHEIRDEIWQTILNDITASMKRSDWDKRPSTAYSGLDLTCHQIRDEIAFFWPRTIVQHSRVTTFIQPDVPNLKDFKRLTLEIPVNQSLGFFQAAAVTLKHLAPVLQDLRLFFVGSDKFQTQLSLTACGLHDSGIDIISRRLPIDGQRHSIRQPLFLALRSLYSLRSLVLSNHNYPVLPKLAIEHKPYLKYLHMVVDPRTTVHKCLDISGIARLLISPIQHGFPPVEVLNISANASLNSLQLAGACSLNLKHLTWTVPDSSLQSAGGVKVNWYHDTHKMLYVLKANSIKLQTLRICFHEAIYEADVAAGILMPAFEHYLPHLPIETFELHMDSNSPWFGREIVQYLPNSLRRLYMSRELLDEELLAQDIYTRYMACHLTAAEGLSVAGSQFLKRLRGTEREEYICAGEDKRRSDFISMGGGKLGFIGYEYEPRKPTRFGDSQLRRVKAEDTKMWMLTLNGRLLDRERNLHLTEYDGANFIPPQSIASGEYQASSIDKHSIAKKYGPLWVYAMPNVKEVRAAAEELQDTVIAKRGNNYFGNEEKAAMVFAKEPVVDPDDVLERLWPDEVSADGGDHWMTDYKSVNRVENPEDLDNKAGGPKIEKGYGCWEAERTAHWVENWTWYPRENSYLEEEGRENFLFQRWGEMLESLMS